MVNHYAIHPSDFISYPTERIRSNFLLPQIFRDNELTNHYSHYDRLIIGGAKPSAKDIHLGTFPELRSEFYLQRRELGVINVGKTGSVSVDGTILTIKNKEALYIGRDSREVIFLQGDGLFYFNSAPAHHAYPTRIITREEAEIVELGSPQTANHRTINKLIVNSVVKTCQVQMGMTELKPGSVWNTMPAHTHDRRMEAYFYFELPEDQMVCHFLGQPQETRHIWIKNHQAVLSPPWSIHSGAGTSNYSFIWGMAGENLDYSDMDAVKITDLR
jgi:4-deoxy-L-threo-5-hexosulose-uronate ketol-isomerase